MARWNPTQPAEDFVFDSYALGRPKDRSDLAPLRELRCTYHGWVYDAHDTNTLKLRGYVTWHDGRLINSDY